MRAATYILQACSAVLMLASMIAGYANSVHGNTTHVVINCITFWANFALFYWQYRIRQNLTEGQ